MKSYKFSKEGLEKAIKDYEKEQQFKKDFVKTMLVSGAIITGLLITKNIESKEAIDLFIINSTKTITSLFVNLSSIR